MPSNPGFNSISFLLTASTCFSAGIAATSFIHRWKAGDSHGLPPATASTTADFSSGINFWTSASGSLTVATDVPFVVVKVKMTPANRIITPSTAPPINRVFFMPLSMGGLDGFCVRMGSVCSRETSLNNVFRSRSKVSVEVPSDRSRLDHLLLRTNAVIEGGDHFRHRLVAVFNLLGDHLLEDGVYLFWHFGTSRSQGRNRVFPMSHELFHDRVTFVGRLAGQQEIQRTPQGVDVGSGIRRRLQSNLCRVGGGILSEMDEYYIYGANGSGVL